jgi:hypothetical protein
MLHPSHADPAAFGLTRPRAVPPKLAIDGINLQLELALLSDGRCVPITAGFDRDGDECGLDDEGLYAFVAGRDDIGWWARFLYEFDFAGLVQ